MFAELKELPARLHRAIFTTLRNRFGRIKMEHRVLKKNKAEKLPEAANLLNSILNEQSFVNDYLEIGVEHGLTFQDVNHPKRIAVDPKFKFNKIIKPRGVVLHEMTSNQFFESLDVDKKFGLVFLDGLHTYQQTSDDFLNLLPHLTKKSVVVIDDTVPCDEYSANPNQMAAYESRKNARVPNNGSWHGDVFKLVIALRRANIANLHLATLKDLNNPKTLVWMSGDTDWPKSINFEDTSKLKYVDFFTPTISQELNPGLTFDTLKLLRP
jgi:hypothetical protein